MKTSKYKGKIICGYRKDQEYTIDANELHKAYYLFNHPNERGTFRDGTAVLGADIRRIEPDYNATMGWNETYQLTPDDWAELNQKGVALKLRDILSTANEISKIMKSEDLQALLIDLVRGKYQALAERNNFYLN